ncbi:MAG: FHA domain-containing protein [Labilithrix sp.]|nr:FHA domain-containing protein [Labilithrix sp.]MCW5814356.1 FHA domain-containing protein [Labilithrix sp.]
MQLVVPPGGSFREPRRIPLGARPLTIGRAEKCEIRVDVPGVDDEHATISVDALISIGPDCAIGDVPLDAGVRRLIMPGDDIQIGPIVLVVEGAPRALPGGAHGPRVRVVEGQSAGSEVVLAEENREYIIGRAKTADLVLKDREVSREHLKIVRRGPTILIHDQASTRGSWLGRSAVYQGATIEWEVPRMLKIGATVLALDLPPELRRAAPSAIPSAPMTAPPRSAPAAQTFTPSPEVLAAGPPTNVGVYHYEAKPQNDGAIVPSTPGALPATPSSSRALERGGWKASGTKIGKGSGLLLLLVAGVAILGALFVVFSLME